MSFGGWSIDKGLYDFISQNLEDGKTILEFGSGNATSELVKKWKVYSVEENSEWVGKFHDNYIYAPIENQSYTEENGWQGWYNREIVKKHLPFCADLILIDGPCYGDRNGIFENINLIKDLGFKFLIFDDVERPKDLECYNNFVNYFKLNNINIENRIISNEKSFAYIKIK